jgi:hypothetical protein
MIPIYKIQSTFLRFIIILPSNPHVGFSKCVFPSLFLNKIPHLFHPSPSRATNTDGFSSFYLFILTTFGAHYKSCSSWLCKFASFSLFSPLHICKIFLSFFCGSSRNYEYAAVYVFPKCFFSFVSCSSLPLRHVLSNVLFTSSCLFSTSAFPFVFHVQYILKNFIPFEVQNYIQHPAVKFNYFLFFILTCFYSWYLLFYFHSKIYVISKLFCLYVFLYRLKPCCGPVTRPWQLTNSYNQISKASNTGGSALIDT